MSSDLFFENKKYISAKNAAKLTSYTPDYVGQLCRAGGVDAKKIGRTWYVCEKSIIEHKNIAHHSDIGKNNLNFTPNSVVSRPDDQPKKQEKVYKNKFSELKPHLEKIYQNVFNLQGDYLKKIAITAFALVMTIGLYSTGQQISSLYTKVSRLSDSPDRCCFKFNSVRPSSLRIRIITSPSTAPLNSLRLPRRV